MDIVAIESKTFEQMKGRFEDFIRQFHMFRSLYNFTFLHATFFTVGSSDRLTG